MHSTKKEMVFTNLEQQIQNHHGLFERYPEIFPCGDATFIRATNIRDALKIMQDGEVKPENWNIDAVDAIEINKASLGPPFPLHPPILLTEISKRQATGISVLADQNEGLHNLFVIPVAHLNESEMGNCIRRHFKHYDIFALAKQPTSAAPGMLQWVMEWAEVKGTWNCALYLYSSGWINVSLEALDT